MPGGLRGFPSPQACRFSRNLKVLLGGPTEGLGPLLAASWIKAGGAPLLRRSGPHRGSGGSSGSTINFGVMFVHLSSHRKSFSIRLVPGSGSTGPHCCLFWFLSSSSTRFGFTNEDGPKGVLVLIHLRRVALFLGHCWSCCWAS